MYFINNMDCKGHTAEVSNGDGLAEYLLLFFLPSTIFTYEYVSIYFYLRCVLPVFISFSLVSLEFILFFTIWLADWKWNL